MPTEMLTKEEHRAAEAPPPAARPSRPEEPGEAARRYAARVRRLQLGLAAWGAWTILITALWVWHEWDANGALERFGHEGDPGQWNPTLWALGIGIPTLVVGIMALGVRFARPAADPATRRRRQLAFHAAAWLLGMVVLTPLWALIEWQDNGGFERWSDNSRPGDWDPWILAVGGIWALSALALLVARRALERPAGTRRRGRRRLSAARATPRLTTTASSSPRPRASASASRPSADARGRSPVRTAASARFASG